MQNLNDQLGREIDYLRISITDRCNLRCRYCMPAEGVESKNHQEILSYEEILKIVETGMEMGIKKVRITGGEPLVRLGVEDFISHLKKLELEDISMTSNAVLLAGKAKKLKEAGLQRINISLDTLDPEKFKEISRRDNLTEVLKGISAALNVGLDPVKLNVVIMKGINDDELFDFVELSRRKKLSVRFIEYMPLGGEAEAEKFISSSEIKHLIRARFDLLPAVSIGNGPANYFKLQGAEGTIGFISAMSEHFCSSCNRLRLTADGKFKPCLAANQEIKITGMSKKDIKTAYKKALKLKPVCHNLNFENQNYSRNMSQIGG
ncbi:cyclic pyranopterin monophosphate synthase subunit MoaA [Halanaerobium saccharolyticum]|uniref:GTP 3',8-cyclase n=1 Tax=Halanaerobium saccharolyticum TaxID=43595 RepID=A0A4V3G5X0_9FIRM|nr:GTP 3',8-cyclase MoaA [Halanaerobium saccharolyticum]RAK09391.1 cyclic pyranopterin phosphate synthase [Halanaerobium saccharolyticum]TDW06250.1 cyclic pyranopterin monophosphate synthase subunit MoaA [Halanaerobium saccharolyticum]TDX61044.1 cyclic pyranopterin phosphate synthase [Halanaerobium saccharolyticum]